jgi:hypothetical protein
MTLLSDKERIAGVATECGHMSDLCAAEFATPLVVINPLSPAIETKIALVRADKDEIALTAEDKHLGRLFRDADEYWVVLVIARMKVKLFRIEERKYSLSPNRREHFRQVLAGL